MERGSGIDSTTSAVNAQRYKMGMLPYGRSTIVNAYHRLQPLVTPIKKRSQGSSDVSSKWCNACYNWVKQLAIRLKVFDPKVMVDPKVEAEKKRGGGNNANDTAASPTKDASHEHDIDVMLTNRSNCVGRSSVSTIINKNKQQENTEEMENNANNVTSPVEIPFPIDIYGNTIPPMFDGNKLTPICRHQIVFFDETHQQCLLGSAGVAKLVNGKEVQVRFPKDEKGNIDIINGTYRDDELQNRLQPKYPKEIRLVLGVAAVKNVDGTIEGKRALPFDYTGRKVLSCTDIVKGFGASMVKTLATKQIVNVGDYLAMFEIHPEHLSDILSYGKNVSFQQFKRFRHLFTHVRRGAIPEQYIIDHRKANHPYMSRYGANWKHYFQKLPSLRQFICIIDLVVHMKKETDRLMKNTMYEGHGLFYHDALSEVMPLDCHLNQDIHLAVKRHAAITDHLPSSDARKFSIATPHAAVNAYLCIWNHPQGVPSSSRIINDINCIIDVHLLSIMEAEGSFVEDLGNRSGKRYMKVSSKSRGGKRTKKPYDPTTCSFHPDVQDVVDEDYGYENAISLLHDDVCLPGDNSIDLSNGPLVDDSFDGEESVLV